MFCIESCQTSGIFEYAAYNNNANSNICSLKTILGYLNYTINVIISGLEIENLLKIVKKVLCTCPKNQNVTYKCSSYFLQLKSDPVICLLEPYM